MMNISNTICAPATSVGAGAVSIIRVSGPDALAVADKVVAFRHGSCAAAQGYTLKYGTVEGVDDVLVSVFRAPHSYTGEDVLEIQAHGSNTGLKNILQAVLDSEVEGVRMAEPGEFTKLAFLIT